MLPAALFFLFILALPLLLLIGKLIQRLLSAPPLPKGCFLVKRGNRWAFKHGTYHSQFSYHTKRGAVTHALGYLKNLSKL
jgi:hypothetical protein